MGALDNYSLVFVIVINFFGQLKDWVGQVLFLVSCMKGQVEKYANVEAWWPINTEFLGDDWDIFRVGVFRNLAFHCKILNMPWKFDRT